MNIQKYDNHVQRLIEELMEKRAKHDSSFAKTATRLLRRAQELEDDALIGFSCYYIAESHYIYSMNHDNFKKTVIRAMEHLQAASEYMLLGRCYNLLGIDSLLHGTMSLGMDYLMTALRYCDNNSGNNLKGIVQSNVGHIYADLGDYQEALRYMKDALEEIRKYPNDPMYSHDMVLCYTLQGNYYLHHNHKLEKAKISLKHAHEILMSSKTPEDVSDQFLYSILNIKILHYSGKTPERDAEIANLMVTLSQWHSIADMAEDIVDIGFFLLEIGDLQNVKSIIEITEPYMNSLELPSVKIQIVQLKIEYYAKADMQAELQHSTVTYYELSQLLKRNDAVSYKFSVDVRRSMEEMRVSQEKIQKENMRLTRQAEYDQLTSLPNRYHLNRFSDQAFERAFHNKTSLAVEILDIDYFKEYNDTYGHQAGDTCLQKIAEQIQLLARSCCGIYCARYGGDEFVLIYENKTDNEVTEFAAKLRDMVIALHIPNGGSRFSSYITISQGIRNSVPKEENKLWDYMYTADNALYNVKQHKKGEIVLLHSAVISQKSLEDAKRT